MRISEVLLDEAKDWSAIEKKINSIEKAVEKIDKDIWLLRKNILKAGGEPEDWSTASGYARDDFINILEKAQEIVDMFK